MTWDTAADFLLSLQPDNLFEQADARQGREHVVRCKGCGELLHQREQEKHHRAHRRSREREKARAVAQAQERGLKAARRARARQAPPQ